MRRAGAGRPERDELLRPYRIGALVLLVLGVLCVLVELQSPSLVYWTGERVPATDDAGIVYYTVDGQDRTLNDPHEAPARPEPVVVYADPEDGSRDRLAGAGRAFDAVFVLAPFVAAGVVVVVGLVRRRRFRRRVAEADRRRSPRSPEGVRPGTGDGSPPSRPNPRRRSSR